MKTKKIKAYGIVSPKGRLISWDMAAYLGLAVILSEREAKSQAKKYTFEFDAKYTAVPVEILLPQKPKNTKKK